MYVSTLSAFLCPAPLFLSTRTVLFNSDTLTLRFSVRTALSKTPHSKATDKVTLVGELNVRAGLELGLFNPYMDLNGKVELEFMRKQNSGTTTTEGLVLDVLMESVKSLVDVTIGAIKKKLERMGRDKLDHFREKMNAATAELEKDMTASNLNFNDKEKSERIIRAGMLLAKEFGTRVHEKLMRLLSPYVVRKRSSDNAFLTKIDEAVELCRKIAKDGVDMNHKLLHHNHNTPEQKETLKAFEDAMNLLKEFRNFDNFKTLFDKQIRDTFLEVFFGTDKVSRVDRHSLHAYRCSHTPKGYDPSDDKSERASLIFKYQARRRICSLAKIGLLESSTNDVTENIMHMVANIFTFPWEYKSRSHSEVRDDDWVRFLKTSAPTSFFSF